MDTLDRYVIKEFLMYYVVIHLGLAVLAIGIDFMSHFWDMKMALGKVIEIYGYKLPVVLQQFFPLSCLMATLLVLTGMSRQNEILALYSSGIGTLRLASTLVAVVATLSTFSFLFFDSMVPVLNKRRMLVEQGLDPSLDEVVAHNRGGFWYRSGPLIYNFGRYLPNENRMEDVNVYSVAPDFYLEAKLHAKEAHFRNNDWALVDGFVVTYPRGASYPVTEVFKTRRGVIREKPQEFKRLSFTEETMHLRDLRRYITINQGSGLDITASRVQYHERVALVFTPLIFVLIGIPYGIKPLRSQSMMRSVGFCFFAAFVYLVMFRLSLSVGKGGHLPPVVAAWGPNVLFLVFSAFTLTRRTAA